MIDDRITKRGFPLYTYVRYIMCGCVLVSFSSTVSPIQFFSFELYKSILNTHNYTGPWVSAIIKLDFVTITYALFENSCSFFS
jgi:hypothetical protein